MIKSASDIIEPLTRGDATLDDIRRIYDVVQTIGDANLRGLCTINGTEINPFFVPTTPPATQPLNSMQWLYMVSQARASAAGAGKRRILVAAPMKSGSTFVTKALSEAFGVPRMSLVMLLTRAYDYANFGAAQRAHEIDELGLLGACIRPHGFVAHHHMIASPYLARQAELYGLDLVLIRRNIFDMLVSLDDYTLKYTAEDTQLGTFFGYGVPARYAELDFDRRIARLLDRHLGFYVNYYVSWALAEKQGLIKPFWISYEKEISGGAGGLSDRIAATFARTGAERAGVANAFGQGETMENIHFNKGIAGRGEAITGANRDRVLDAFADFSDTADFSDLLG